MNLSIYDRKHVRITDKWGEVFTGTASYAGEEFLECEYGGEEDGIFIGDCLIYNSQIVSIEEAEVHGTAELLTDRLMLRRYREEDADELYRRFGADPEMTKYSGWNPYATPEAARATVQRFIESYSDKHFYSWIIDWEDVVIGTIGAYDYEPEATVTGGTASDAFSGANNIPGESTKADLSATGGTIEVGFSIDRACWGRGYATEALKCVLAYLTGNEGIGRVTAWCASENAGSRRVLEKAGMELTRIEKAGLAVGDQTHDQMFFEYRGLPR